MSSMLVTSLVWIAAVSSGLMAGVYFAFSVFIMKAFDSLEPPQAVGAMNAINRVILRSLFMPLFFGSTLVSALMMVAVLIYPGEPGAVWASLAGAAYFFGMFVCTAVFNVPLNNGLSQVEPASDNAAAAWSHYFNTWTRWNHVRTISSLLTCVICIGLLAHE